VMPTTIWRRTAALLLLLVSAIICCSCGDTFRPVAVPVVGPPPDPQNFHFAIVVNQNAPANPGSGLQIDVSGDTNVGVAHSGPTPVHAALTANAARVYLANSNGTVSTFAPAPPCFIQPCTVTGTGPVTNISLPGSSTPLPVFLHSTESATMYVADASNSAVLAINTTSNAVANTIALPAGSQPSVLAETPDTKKLYSVNQGTKTISSINVIDKSVNPPIVGFTNPVWAVASLDSKNVFVLDQATGVISAVDTFSEVVGAATGSVGAGANFMLLDRRLNRLYVTNPAASTLSIFDASTTNTAISPATPPRLLATVSVPGVNMVTALPDGSRVYASSSTVAPCATVAGDTCASWQVTVIRTSDNTITKTLDFGPVDLMTLYPPSLANPTTPGPNVAVLACSAQRFPTSIASSADSKKVYVADCFAGSTTIINTVNDAAVLPINSPVSAYCPPLLPGQTLPCQAPAPGQTPLPPPPENPVWIVTEAQ
jgi:DNA-binding beta-propeller fold protein YncE